MKFVWIACPLLILGFLFRPCREPSDARRVAAKAQIDLFLVSLKNYHSDTGEFPTEAQGLRALRINPGVHGWKGPYLARDVPQDPWGEPYQYHLTSDGPWIFSVGGRNSRGQFRAPLSDSATHSPAMAISLSSVATFTQ